MNELSPKDYSLMSTEVAVMVEKDHDKLLRDIRRYTNQMSAAKIGESDFWIETTYMNDRGKTYPCYLITKKGCEFIAHKMTGAKGTVFTARYINRFHEMEEHIKQQMPKPELEQKKEPTYLLSTVPCPRANLFYRRYNNCINSICEMIGMTRKQYYSKMLRYLSKKYDLEEAKRIYTKALGHKPRYQADIIGFFPDLMEEAEDYLWKTIVNKKAP